MVQDLGGCCCCQVFHISCKKCGCVLWGQRNRKLKSSPSFVWSNLERTEKAGLPEELVLVDFLFENAVTVFGAPRGSSGGGREGLVLAGRKGDGDVQGRPLVRNREKLFGMGREEGLTCL